VNVHSRRSPSFGRRMPLRRSRSVLVVFHHLDGFRRSRLPACCSRYQVWVRQVSPGSVVEAEASRAVSWVLAGAPPCEGLLLVGSRTASLRPAPLLPFVTCDLAPTRVGHKGARASLRPDPEIGWGSSGSIRPCRLHRFRWLRQASDAVLRPPRGDGSLASARRPSVRARVAPLAPATCARIVSNRRSPGCGSTRRPLTSR
jgi:hypothetical protein